MGLMETLFDINGLLAVINGEPSPANAIHGQFADNYMFLCILMFLHGI